MNGAIVINKPVGITSRDVVNRLNQILETKEIGHTGTLDPMATGVLVCLVGKATKLSNILTSQNKEYIATFKLGILTDTLDITGKIITNKKVSIKESEIKKILKSYIKTYNQEVPIYSAVKVDGKKLYEYARNNEEVELPKRDVTIYDIELLSIKDDIIKIKTKVSKGTYIRSLVRDIGASLGTVATLTELERTSLGSFNIENAASLDDVLYNKHYLYSVVEILKDYPQEEIDPEMLYKVKNGQILDREIKDYILFVVGNKEIALYQKYDKDPEKIKPAVMFY
ncbi:MAG: tRNA pseudouridine(55) synthase TruB [Bacilli bacterium]|nr:tRNA pseudouridine(55) synthase TruB [Bacilli bacterium]MDD4795207.1 tRNA pseudouridine(55) synthase TruB [Bacilli bacterium]